MRVKEISILMPVKNCNFHIHDAIKSILNQTYKEFEFIIIDSSEDETSEIISNYKDSRIRYIYNKNFNLSESLNYGISISANEYIARMDADDISDVNRIKEQLYYLDNKEDLDIVGTNYFLINKNGNVLYEKKMPEFHNDIEFMMPITASILHPTIFFKKKAILEINGYSSEYKTEDVDLFLRLIEKGRKMYNIQKPLFYYRSLRKKGELIEEMNSSQKILGKKFISRKYYFATNTDSLYEKHLSIGLLEYYCGDMREARSNFKKCIKMKKNKILKIYRYLLFSYFGNKIMNFNRKLRISFYINLFVNKIFNYELKISKRSIS